AADEGAASDALARLEVDGDAGIILLEVLDRAIGLQRDKIVALARIDEDRMEVVPVCDGIGLLETVGEAGIVKGNAGHGSAGERQTHWHPRWPVSIGEHRLLEPEPFECAEDVGAELDAGTDLAEFRRLFQDAHRESLVRERVRRRQPPDAAT